jgi:AraC-like DNA-binding protein
MRVRYDTDTVAGPDRWDYYRDAAASEVAPVAVKGRAPGRLRAAQSGAQAGEFLVEATTYAADSTIEIVRNDRMIRVGDPDCYRMCLNTAGGEHAEQAGSQVCFGARDIGLYSLSAPYHTCRPTGMPEMRVVMVTFPRRLLPVSEAKVTPLLGRLLPRRLPGRSLFAQFLIALTASSGPGPDPEGLAVVLREATAGLIRERLGLAGGFTPATRRLLYQQWARAVIGRQADDPELNPARIARAVGISESYLHQLFRGAGQTPMQLVKATRLDRCHRDLRDPALATRTIRDIAAAHGYRRPDQFAHDFRQRFTVPATHIHRPAPRPHPRRPA